MPQVTVVTLKTQSVSLTRELPGRTSAYLVAEVRPQVGGIVRRRLFTEGGHVKAGQLLYDLDDTIYQAQYASAQAGLRKAQAALRAARLAAARSRELIRINAVSAQDNDRAIAAEAQGEADVAAAQAAVNSSQIRLAYAHITAPISGRIGKSSVTQGALVTSEQPAALATIQQLDPIYVELTETSSDWLALRQAIEAGRAHSQEGDATVTLLLENGIQYGYRGRLQFSDVTVDPATGSFQLRAIVPNPRSLLLPGMYVRAVLNEGALTAAVLVPQRGIQRDTSGNASALILDKDDRVALRSVQVSRTVGDQWLVDQGLEPGDRVIIEGLQRARPGAPAQAVVAGGGSTQAQPGSPPIAVDGGDVSH